MVVGLGVGSKGVMGSGVPQEMGVWGGDRDRSNKEKLFLSYGLLLLNHA